MPLLLYAEGEPEHDFDPAWDYELGEDPAPYLVEAAREAAARVASASGLKFHLYAVDLTDQGVLARYADGTAELPVILIDLNANLDACELYDAPLAVALRTSIGHELGHARQEYEGRDSDEDDAEAFAAFLEARISG